MNTPRHDKLLRLIAHLQDDIEDLSSGIKVRQIVIARNKIEISLYRKELGELGCAPRIKPPGGDASQP